VSALSAPARLLLWDYERGSLPYDVLCAAIVLFLWLVPGTWLGDPMTASGVANHDVTHPGVRP